MFNDAYGLTQATIEGRKKNTRRAEFTDEEQQVLNEADDVYMDGDDVVAHFDSAEDVRFATRYKVGEVVAVAQNYERIHDEICKTSRYDGLYVVLSNTAGWRNKMFVKAELMPHRIRITGKRAERLQDISDEDCIKEGIRKFVPNFPVDFPIHPIHYVVGDILRDTPREAFSALIDKVSGRGTWASNPWVVAYEYELIK